MNLLILSCSQAKRPDVGEVMAYRRYDGPAYRVLRKWMTTHQGWQGYLRIRILSAEYGMISPLALIPDYDRRMTRDRAVLLRDSVVESFERLLAVHTTFARVFVTLGATYRLALPDPLPFVATEAQGGIGQRAGQLKLWLEGLDVVS
jgi:hypothetical protein